MSTEFIPAGVLRILRHVANAYGLTVAEVRSGSQTRAVAPARHLCAYVLREKCGYSYPAIAKHLGLANHTSAMYGVSMVARGMASDENARRLVAECLATLSTVRTPHLLGRWTPPPPIVNPAIEVREWRF